MSVHEVMENFFFVERGFLNANHFVCRSKDPVLVDTGYVRDFEDTAQYIEGLGVQLSRIRSIICTHSHSDHIGGNKTIHEISGCDIAMHKIGKHFMDTKDDWSPWWRYYGQEADFFPCTKRLEDGETIPVGPHEFQIIYTPGHASDGIVLYCRKEKVLLSSDTLWENDMAVVTIRVEGSSAVFSLQESLEKLEALDVRIVFPGHGPPFEDIKGAMLRAKNRLQSYLKHKEKVGEDLLRKIIVYTLLIKREIDEDAFFMELMRSHWFKETIDFYFGSDYRAKYDDVIHRLCQKGVVRRADGELYSTVKP